MTGIKPSTGRKNQFLVKNARDEADAYQQIRASGLIEPYTCELLPADPPTERQLDFAKDLRLILPPGANMRDVSGFIARVWGKEDWFDFDETAPTPGLARFADDMRVWFSRCDCQRALEGYVLWGLTGADQIAFYAYCIHCAEKHLIITDPRASDRFELFRRIGMTLAADPSVTRSVENNRLDPREINRSTKIYQAIKKMM